MQSVIINRDNIGNIISIDFPDNIESEHITKCVSDILIDENNQKTIRHNTDIQTIGSTIGCFINSCSSGYGCYLDSKKPK